MYHFETVKIMDHSIQPKVSVISFGFCLVHMRKGIGPKDLPSVAQIALFYCAIFDCRVEVLFTLRICRNASSELNQIEKD